LLIPYNVTDVELKANRPFSPKRSPFIIGDYHTSHIYQTIITQSVYIMIAMVVHHIIRQGLELALHG